MGYIYLLHFTKPLKHCKHYLGFAESDCGGRIESHRKGTSGVKIFNILHQKGIADFVVARVWPNKTRTQERLMKKRGKGSICPICKEKQENNDRNRNNKTP